MTLSYQARKAAQTKADQNDVSVMTQGGSREIGSMATITEGYQSLSCFVSFTKIWGERSVYLFPDESSIEVENDVTHKEHIHKNIGSQHPIHLQKKA